MESYNQNGVVLFNQNRAQSFATSQMKVRMGPSGIQLFERTSGLNILLDEVRIPPACPDLTEILYQ
jgi:hypothetical protein